MKALLRKSKDWAVRGNRRLVFIGLVAVPEFISSVSPALGTLKTAAYGFGSFPILASTQFVIDALLVIVAVSFSIKVGQLQWLRTTTNRQ